MSDDFRRRRRLSNTGSPRRSSGGSGMNPWVVTIFAAIVVIAGGWFLGQTLARIFNGPPKNESVAKRQAPTPLPVVTPPPSPSPAASLAPTPTPEPAATPKPTPRPTPTPTPAATSTATVNVTAAPSAAPAPTPTATSAPTAAPSATPALRHTQPIARRPEPTATPAPVPQNPAARVVHAYIDALRRGDPAAAAAYLGNGTPDESFIDSSTRITSITTARNADGSYKVSVDMQTAKGEYFETFTVASNQILQKTAIKP